MRIYVRKLRTRYMRWIDDSHHGNYDSCQGYYEIHKSQRRSISLYEYIQYLCLLETDDSCMGYRSDILGYIEKRIHN